MYFATFWKRGARKMPETSAPDSPRLKSLNLTLPINAPVNAAKRINAMGYICVSKLTSFTLLPPSEFVFKNKKVPPTEEGTK